VCHKCAGHIIHSSVGFMRLLRYLFMLLLIVLLPLSGCHPQRKAIKAERQQERVAKQREREAAAAYEQAKKRHMELQTRETRQRMRETRKQSERIRITRKPWWQRLFKRSR
jgi:hypothetical protein